MKILNKDSAAHEFALEATGIDGLVIVFDDQNLSVLSGEVAQLTVRLRADPAMLQTQSSEVLFRLSVPDMPELTTEAPARFLGRTLR